MEKDLKQLSEKMLMVVAIKYGKDSAEYEIAGGIRNSDRVRKMRSSRLKNIAEKALVEEEFRSQNQERRGFRPATD
ncbi:hypothetical protein A6770_19680 [Nostoc minutum NIES-26]|uniref:Uncharacterized protein n=1 Tax=Nostoc minutum NIES-26 TaxID=1844469 RepID=A0A367R654_9NOSO|nr:hypothetical protein A6770_19680 [Nostoc minutum NIES-26]